jgi:bacterial leucyl aminopeptidase
MRLMSIICRFATIFMMGFFVVVSSTVIAQSNKQRIVIAPGHSINHTEYSIKYQKEVTQLIRQINPQNMWADLTVLTSYPDRHANSTYKVNGLTVEEFIKNKIEMIVNYTGRKDVKIYMVDTGGEYKQSSVIVKLGDSNAPGVVIGAHMDTVRSTAKELKPGADDDGSGAVTIMEVARTLMKSGISFKKPIYFIWYAAEEEGYVGSKYVVKDFINKEISISAVMQYDMTGYAPKENNLINLITNNTDTALTNYLATLIKTYLNKKIYRTTCDGDCSDYLSWNKAGFSASFPFEIDENPYIHTSADTMDKLSLDHMTDFAQLGVAFAVELAEPV